MKEWGFYIFNIFPIFEAKVLFFKLCSKIIDENVTLGDSTCIQEF